MAYTYQQMIDQAKREARVGVVGDYSEQYTIDCVEYLNRVCLDAWEMFPWDFSKTAISLTLTALQSTEETLDAAIGEIIVLGVQGKRGALKPYTELDYQSWKKPEDQAQSTPVYGYIHRGLDSNGAIKVLFVDTPSEATTIVGEGKTAFSKIALADVAAGTTLPYFPDHMAVILVEWLTGILCTAVNDPRGPGMIASAGLKLRRKKGTVKNGPDESPTSPAPDLIRYGSRHRGGTHTA